MNTINKKVNCEEIHFRIVAKRYNRDFDEFVFTLADNYGNRFNRSANELCHMKLVIMNISLEDCFDIAYTAGSEATIKELQCIKESKRK